MKTAAKDLIEKLQKFRLIKEDENSYELFRQLELESLEKEKEQIIAAVRYGQNNHTASVYDEGELYYNEIYNSDTQIIKSSIPNGNIEVTKTNNL